MFLPHMHKIRWIFFFVACLSTALAKNAYGVDIHSVRLGIHENKTRLVLDLTEKDAYTLLEKKSPTHFRVLLHKSKIPAAYMSKQKGKKHIKAFYFTPGPKQNITLHVETHSSCEISKIFTIPQSKTEKFRIVLDFQSAKIKAKEPHINPKEQKTSVPTPLVKPKRRVVVIDAGHGGKDPGTIQGKIQEKDITLAVAQEMKRIIDASGKYTAILTRTQDKHMPLRQRFSIAREKGANLLISLHADSHPDKNIKGVSIYTLSENASDKEAQRLAEKENSADFLEDLSFTQNTEQEVKDILINISQTRSKNHALVFADLLIKRLKNKEVMLKNSHRAADFAVLKAPDVASVLIELGYLSNVNDQKRLVSRSYQRKIAALIVMAIDDYFEQVKS